MRVNITVVIRDENRAIVNGMRFELIICSSSPSNDLRNVTAISRHSVPDVRNIPNL